ncbi:MAG: serine/threonine-protein kinase [Myxococcales bacterium]|nr:serine/threonine-protein kinase [Myxococcales bacterium]
MPAQRLGPYEMRALLGSGASGVVWRARDTRMGRNVAIKVLDAGVVQRRPEQVQRFELEARAAGGLNHPNLVTVHDFGKQDDTRYLVTEFLVGRTLRAEMDAGPIEARKAIDYAIQIARGLSAAHEKGILHRDLKPDNIFVTREGRVKILDFGIAKLFEPEARARLLGEARGFTAPGVVVGTAQYVSPEQARDLPLDHRSDLFSLGLVLFEMLSGTRPFRGKTPVEVMTAIARDEPEDLVYPGERIPGLDAIVRHCLEKAPERRVQSARDLIFQLEGLTGAYSPQDVTDPGRPPPSPRRRWVPAAIMAALVALPLASFFFGRRAAATVMPSFHKLTFRRGAIWSARFAPDGETVVYSAIWDADRLQLFSTRPESPESRALGIADAKILSISSTGELAILQGTPIGTLSRVPLAGGAPRELMEKVFEADWGPDGQSLAVVRRIPGKFVLEYPAGKKLYETGGWITGVRVSRDGERVAFVDHPVKGDLRGTVAVVDKAGTRKTLGREWLITGATQGLAWSPVGTEIWFTAGAVAGITAVHAVDLEGRERVVMPSTGNLTLQDVTPGGHLLLSQSSLRLMLMAKPKDQEKPRDLSWMDGSVLADLSEDGKTLVFLEAGEAQAAQKKGAIYLRPTDGSPAMRLAEGSVSRLSPDGKWVIAAPGADFSTELMLLPTGAGDAVKVPLGGVTLAGDPLWFPDGKSILLRGHKEKEKDRLWALSLPAQAPRPVTPEGIGGVDLVSPDGKLVAVADPEGKLTLYPVDGGSPRPVAGANPADTPIGWKSDGSAIFAYQPRERPCVVRLLDLKSGARTPWKPLTPPDPAGVGPIIYAKVTGDGQSYAFNYEINLHDLYFVDGVH